MDSDSVSGKSDHAIVRLGWIQIGLSSCAMTGFDAAAVHAAFGLGPDEVPVMLLAVGYAAQGNWPQKPRRPLADVLRFA